MKGKIMKKVLSLAMTVILVLGMLPQTAFAVNETHPASVAGEITAFKPLADSAKTQTVPPGTSLKDLKLPETLSATILSSTPDNSQEQKESVQDSEEQTDGNEADIAVPHSGDETIATNTPEMIPVLKWTAVPAYDPQTAGSYVFTPVFGEQYSLGEGVAAPSVTIQVVEAITPPQDSVKKQEEIRDTPQTETGNTIDASDSTAPPKSSVKKQPKLRNTPRVSVGNTIDVGDSTTAAGDGWTYADGVFIITGDVTITGTTTTNRIKVQRGSSVNITLNNADIQVSGNNVCAFDLTDASVNLTLENANMLTSGEPYAALQAPTGATLTVGGTGSLTAIGGHEGAGIGGRMAHNGGNITISGGVVNAIGGYSAAGIGGGRQGSGGNIIITDGKVNASSSSIMPDSSFSYLGGGAGIGGGGGSGTGASGASGSITITGNASVTATGGSSPAQAGGAGIGSGGGGSTGSVGAVGDSANPITINIPVTATGGTGVSGRDGAPVGSGGQKNGAGTSIIPETNLTTYTITAEAGIGGSISPAGSIEVVKGASRTFTVTADPEYVIASVMIDGVAHPVTNPNRYTFTMSNITGPRTITAAFERINAETPSIKTQPQLNTTCIRNGTAVPLSVTAEVSDGGVLSYKWYKSTSNSTTNGVEVGTNSASYTSDIGTVGTLYYYCVVTNTNNSLTGIQTATAASAVAEVKVIDIPTVANITVAAVRVGDRLSLATPNIAENGDAVTAQGWEISTDGSTGWTEFNPATVMNYTHNGQYLRYFGANNAGTGYSNTVQLVVSKLDLVLSLICADITYGEEPSPRLTGNAGNGVVTWEFKKQGAEDTAYDTVIPKAAGNYTVRALVAATDTYNAGTATADFSITKATPGITLAASPADGRLEDGKVTLTASLTGVSDRDYPTGNVVFKNGSTVLGRADLSDGSASCTWSKVPDGAYDLKVEYAGDNNYESAADSIGGYNVKNIAAPGIADIKVPAVRVGDRLSLTVPDITDNGDAVTAQGWEISTDGSTGWTEFDPATTMSYAYNGQYLRYFGTNSLGTGYSNTVQLTVSKLDLELSLKCADITYGEEPSPRLTGNAGNGAVTWEFKKQGAEDTAYDTVIPTAVGNYTVRALVADTDTYNAGTATVDFSITKATPDITLAVSPAAGSLEDGKVTLKASLTGVSDSDYPTGSVVFKNGSKVLGRVDLRNGAASYTWSKVPDGTYDLKVEYAGDNNYERAADSISNYNVKKRVQRATTTTRKTSYQRNTAPKTGDNTLVWPFVLLGLAALGTIGFVGVRRKKRS